MTDGGAGGVVGMCEQRVDVEGVASGVAGGEQAPTRREGHVGDGEAGVGDEVGHHLVPARAHLLQALLLRAPAFYSRFLARPGFEPR